MDYKTKIISSANIEASFDAIANGLDKWWGKVDNSISKIGDEFSIFFGKTEWRFKIVEYVPFEKITWKCIKATHVHEGLNNIEGEWLHSELYWNFVETKGKTDIKLYHKGLTPNLNCYEVCKSGWDFFISTSLKKYLETGKGDPHFD